jgi:hypothetical protein
VVGTPNATNKGIPKDPDPNFPYGTLKEFALAVIKLFSSTQLQLHWRDIGTCPQGRQGETRKPYTWRNSSAVSMHSRGGRVVASPEFSNHTTGLKRLDFLVNEQKWRIEALREGDTVVEHHKRSRPGGAYHRFGLHDYILLDFRTSTPAIPHRGK